MKKLNKKGFTLVEMLVVIAIIAILVAIIIPTTTSATTKAKAATDAANLRSALATATIKSLDGADVSKLTAADLGIPANSKLDSGAFTLTVTAAGNGNAGGATIVVKYGDHDIAYYAKEAGESSSTSGGNTETEPTEQKTEQKD